MLAKSLKAASERPEGVIIKHQNLWLEAHKDYSLLNDLEAEYMLLNLDKAEAKKLHGNLLLKPTLLKSVWLQKGQRLCCFGLLTLL